MWLLLLICKPGLSRYSTYWYRLKSFPTIHKQFDLIARYDYKITHVCKKNKMYPSDMLWYACLTIPI